MTYRIVLGIAVIAAAVLTFFTLWGEAGGGILAWAMGYYDASLPFFFVPLAWGIIAVSVAVHRLGNTVLAAVILMPVVLPAIGSGLILLILIFGGLSWR
ncbi:MAG: hypothetical protein KF780_08605 [Sphingomonas sp.]|nr:hypothetical protein [Sphingomonas sp.]